MLLCRGTQEGLKLQLHVCWGTARKEVLIHRQLIISDFDETLCIGAFRLVFDLKFHYSVKIQIHKRSSNDIFFWEVFVIYLFYR